MADLEGQGNVRRGMARQSRHVAVGTGEAVTDVECSGTAAEDRIG